MDLICYSRNCLVNLAILLLENMALTPEGKVKKSIDEYLDSLKAQGHPIYWERRNATGLNYKEGKPDLWVAYNGFHIEIETKQVGGEVRTRQEKWERTIKRCGCIYIRPDSLEEVRNLFEEWLIPTWKGNDNE